MKSRKIFGIAFAVIALLLVVILGGRLIETNNQGESQVKQAFISGKMTARVTPGTYGQWLGTVKTFRQVATVGFGNQAGEGSADIAGIPVIFSDGSKATISGLVRLRLPSTQEGLIALQGEYAEGYDHFIRSGVVPVIQNAVKLSANLRSAQDAYTTLALFQQAIDDQLENGIYLTQSEVKEFVTATGDIESRQTTQIMKDSSGNYLRKANRIQELKCEVLECVIDVPTFDPTVEASIAARKDEAMKTELSKQEALRAKQEAITAEEQGKSNVATAKYTEEVVKIKAVTVAQKELEVAQLQAKQALEQKKQKIAVAQGIAEELRIADGLSERDKYQIDADVKRDIGVAEHMSKWVGPQIVMTGGDSKGGSSGIENALMIKMMNDMIKAPAKK